jgi:transcriptional regulator with XRE-family HTH domain
VLDLLSRIEIASGLVEIPTASQRVAANVRAELARHGRSQGDLGQALSRSQPYVSRRLSGKVAFGVDEVEQIATWLGVPVSALIGQDAAA